MDIIISILVCCWYWCITVAIGINQNLSPFFVLSFFLSFFLPDSVPADRLVDNPNPYYRQGGNRYATLLIYVKAPSEGLFSLFFSFSFIFLSPFLPPSRPPSHLPSPGGHTAFPLAEDKRFSYDKTKSLETNPLEGCNRDISFHVGVKKGAAVLFYDLMEEEHMKGVIDPLSEHAGCDTSVCVLLFVVVVVV